jgi:hypothetical protein
MSEKSVDEIFADITEGFSELSSAIQSLHSISSEDFTEEERVKAEKMIEEMYHWGDEDTPEL